MLYLINLKQPTRTSTKMKWPLLRRKTHLDILGQVKEELSITALKNSYLKSRNKGLSKSNNALQEEKKRADIVRSLESKHSELDTNKDFPTLDVVVEKPPSAKEVHELILIDRKTGEEIVDGQIIVLMADINSKLRFEDFGVQSDGQVVVFTTCGSYGYLNPDLVLIKSGGS